MTGADRSGLGGASLPATIDVAPLDGLLRRLHAAARRALAPAYARASLAVSPAQGRFLYLVARAINAQTIVEFGASHGVSTLYLAAAAHDNFGGRVVSAELDAEKCERVRTHLAEAGLEAFVDLRAGDARESLARNLPAQIDLVLLDGDRSQYRALLGLLRPRLRPGAVVLVASADGLTPSVARLVSELRSGTAGFQSATLPYGAGLEFAVTV